MLLAIAVLVIIAYILFEIKDLASCADSGEFLGNLLGYTIIFFILSAVFG